MNPLHLTEDEFNYELAIRLISLNDPNKINKLIQRIEAETSSRSEFPVETPRLTRQTVVKELQDCEQKVNEIDQFIGTALQQADDQIAEQGQSRLTHISQRIGRLLRFAADNAAVKRLWNRVVEINSDLRTVRDSFGNGERPADQMGAHALDPLQIQAANSNTRSQGQALGAIPKERPTGGFFSSLAEQLPTTTQPVRVGSRFEWREAQPPVPSLVNTNSNPTRSIGSLAEYFEDMRLPDQNEHHNDHSRQFVDQAIIESRVQAEQSQPRNLNPDAQQYFPPATQHPRTRARSEVTPSTNQRVTQPSQVSQGVANGHHIHKWNLRFDGSAAGLEVEDFVFRVERQAQLYGVTLPALVIGIVNLLSGRAAQWYWTNQRQVENSTWAQFKQALIRRYAPHKQTDYEIRSRIENRKQQQSESFNEFCQDIEALAVRMVRRMPEEELIEILKRNMTMTLRKALWREEFHSVDRLLKVSSDFERLCREEDTLNKQHNPLRVSEIEYPTKFSTASSSVSSAPFSTTPQTLPNGPPGLAFHLEAMKFPAGNRTEFAICWNCDDIGHVFSKCPKPQMAYFCFGCGQKGAISINCQKCSGNDKRGPALTDTTSPSKLNRPYMYQHPPPPIQPPTVNPFTPSNKPM